MSEALVLAGLGKDYGKRTAVGTLDLVAHRGEILGLLGPNGAGKTTTISMAAGVITPTRGTVEIGGVSLADRPFEAKRKLGLVPQDLAIYEELSARQNLAYFGALYGLAGAKLAERIAFALAAVDLAGRATEPVKRYSGGMKRRLNLAAGLLHEPEVLILDEPTVGVDPQSRNHIFDTIRTLRASGMTIVYTSHYMEEVEALCDRVAIVDHGAVVALGTVAELVAAHAGTGVEIELAGEAARVVSNVEPHAEVSLTGTTLRIVPRAGLAPVIAAIEATPGVTIVRLASRTASLETAFLALTGRGLRDGATS